jgi:gliding motility-associated-like protein
MKTRSYRFSFILLLVLLLSCLQRESQAQSSLYMPAATNWVSVGDLDVAGNQLTVEALIYYTGASVDIVSKHTNPGDVNYLLRIGSFEISTTSGFAAFGGVAAAGVSIVPNRMYHVAATYDGASLKYYVNGCLTGQMAWTGNMIQSNLITAIGNMSTCQCEQFTGYIDEVRIWNVARTQAQISANMINLPSPTTQPGLLGYWKFDGSLTNMQGNAAFNGVAMGAPQFQQIPLPYPSTLHESVTSSNPVCAGDAGGVINVSATGYYTPYEYSLDGITYGSSPVFSNLSAGAYTVYTRPQNNSGCAVSSPVTITDPPVLNPNLTTTNITCNGAANGTAGVAPSGGDGPAYHQLWQPSFSTATGISGLAAGSYTVTVADTCRAAGPELVTNGHFENGNTGFTSGYSCCSGGPGNYAVDVDPSFYNAGHSGSGYGGGGNYLIGDGSTAPGTSLWCQSIPVSPNTYYTLSAFVTSNYTTSLAVMEFDINGSPVGTVNAPATLFTWDPFQTVWFSGASTSANICIIDQNTIAGGNDYGIDNISFKSCASCSATVPFTITEPPVLTVSTVQSNVSCNGGTNGSATATASGGTPGYSYSWNTVPAQSSATATNLSAGTYTVTITDLNLCSTNTAVTITQPPALSVSISPQTNIACNGGNTGSATAAGNGGTPGYSYSWNTTPAQAAAIASGIPAGTYTVTISDQNSCTSTATVTITEPPALSAAISAQNNISCNGGNNGNATVLANGGAPSYSYAWSTTPAQTGTTAATLSAGIYTVTVTDQNSCTVTATATITEPPVLSASISAQTNVSCNGGTNGTATAAVNGGAPGYLYSWSTSPAQTGATASGLPAGSYTVTVTDLNSCTATAAVTITEPPALTVSISAQTNVSCNGGTNGAATAAVNGGAPGYSYSWNTSPAQTGASASGIPAGSYTITVSDLNSCTATATVSITEPPALTVVISAQTNISCNGGTNGAATAAGNGGSPAYSYSWNTTPAQTGATASGIPAGTYTVTISDLNSCTSTATVSITEPPVLSAAISAQTNVSCNGGNNGNATAAGNGGSPAYSYSWNTSPVQLTAVAVSLTAGTYTVTVSDQNSCTATATVTITEPPVLTVAVSAHTNVSCNGGNNGTATALANGGSPAYSYSWNTSPVQTTATASNLAAGSCTVTVTDANSCTATATVNITQPTALSLALASKTHPSCNGSGNGDIYTAAAGGTGPYSYAWTPNVSTADSAISLFAGSYTITVTDVNNCIATLTEAITDPPLLTVDAGSNVSICRGLTTGLNAATGGGTPAYVYSWSNGAVTPSQTVQPIVTTNYTVTVTDSKSCSATDSVLVTVFQPALIHLGNDTAICQGDVLTLNAGPGFSSYTWQNGTTSQTLNASFPDQYFVTGIDPNGCIVKDTIVVNVNPLPVIGLADTLKICPGTSATLIANPGYVNYAWNTGAATSSITVNSPGTDKVIVKDANGCINSDSTVVVFHPIPVLQFTVQPLVGCDPLSVSTQNTSILNGATIQTWNWQIGPNSINDMVPATVLNGAGLYDVSLEVTTDKGCVVDTLLTNYIEVYPSPQAIIVPEALEYELYDDNINISNQSIQSTYYTWSFNNDSLTNVADLVYPVSDTGAYYFQLLAVNQYGCRDSSDVTIVVNPGFAIFFPDAFTPNDNGNNDKYMPKGYGIKEYELLIFDRWGNMVFKSNDMTVGWDGTYKNNLPFRDVYVYKCRIRDIKGDPHYYYGHITLVQ